MRLTRKSNVVKSLAASAVTAIILIYALFVSVNVVNMMSLYEAKTPHIMTAQQALPQADFGRFWYVGKRLVSLCAARFGYTTVQSTWFTSTFQIDILSAREHPRAVWLYPPTMGLLAMVFSFLPLATSFWTWRLASLAAAFLLLRRAGLGWRVIVAGLACPAEVYDTICGQTGALTTGLLVSALLLIETRPRVSGMLTGLLSVKPQLCMIAPLILLHKRHMPAIIAGSLTSLLLVVVSILLQGWQMWVWFLTVAEPNSSIILNGPVDSLGSAGFTVLMMARHLHASVYQAWMLQAGVSVGAASAIWFRWQKPVSDPVQQMALTVSLLVLVMPYGYAYDLVAFGVGMSAMFARAPIWQKPIFAAMWLMTGLTITIENSTGFVVMPVAAVVATILLGTRPRPRPSELGSGLMTSS